MVAAANQPPPPGAVLYVDHAHHLTPLTLTYHATAARHLTSGRSDVIPPSTTAEVDSAYCPRSLTYCDAASASASGARDNPFKDCPVCFSPVSFSIDENTSNPEKDGRLVCHFLCSYCQWSSRECGVTANADKLLEYATSDETDPLKEKEAEKQRGIIITEASKELEICLQEKIQEKNKDGDALFNSMTKMWAQREQEEARRKRMNVRTTAPKTSSKSTGGSWSWETVEKSLLEKKKELASPYTNGKDGSNPAGDAIKPDATIDKPTMLPTSQQMAAQMTLTTVTPRSRSDLFPLPVAYRARVSRRCRAELAAGRTGILVKPKLNPLEGDTSLRAGHGQWWKKDSSAVHVVPRVQLCQHGADPAGQKYAALLKVKNPTLNMIRLRLSGPSSSGVLGEDGELAPLIQPHELQNILLDPFTETFVKGHLCAPDTTASLTPTDFVELEPADDPFLDIGKGLEMDPLEVRGWDVASSLSELSDGSTSHLRVLASQGDTAWVEMILCDASASSGEDQFSYLAVPMALQIEVGNGSWEASLVKRRDLPEEEKDLVTLNLFTLLR